MHEPFVAICSRVAQSHHDCGASPRLWCFAAISSVRSESVDSGMTAASGDVGEEVHFLSDRAWELVDIQSERRAADQSTDLVGKTPFLAPATAGSANAGHQYSRTPHCPHNEREDMGHGRLDARVPTTVGKTVGCDVDDPHHERPADRTIAARQRQPHGPQLPVCGTGVSRHDHTLPPRQPAKTRLDKLKTCPHGGSSMRVPNPSQDERAGIGCTHRPIREGLPMS